MASLTKVLVASASDPGAWSNSVGANTTATEGVTGDSDSVSGHTDATALEMAISGRSKSNANFWTWAGTWEDLGIPAGSTVTSVQLVMDWRCSTYTTGAASTHGPVELRDSADTLLGTFLTGLGFSATSAWATRTGSSVSVPSGQQASNSTIHLRLNDTLATGASNSAAVKLHETYIQVVVTYTPPIKVITPAGISATSTVSGRIGPRKVIPAGISATSTVTSGQAGSISFVKEVAAHADNTSASSKAIAIANAPAAGNMVLLIFSGDRVPTITDSKGNTWTVAKQGTNTPVLIHAYTFQDAGALTTADTINLDFGGITSNYFVSQVLEFSGVKVASSVDQTSEGSITGFSTSRSAGSVTTTQPVELIVATFGDGTGTAGLLTAGSGYSLPPTNEITDASANVTISSEYRIVTSAGTYSATGTGSTSTPTDGIATSFIAATVPGITVIPGGGGGTTKSITPAGISATSSVSGGIKALRRVLPAGITATSVVSGAIRAIRAIGTAGVSATSSVTGSIGRLKPLAPTGISATSVVSGSIRALRRIVGAISATSAVSGTVTAFHRIGGAVAATSTVSGSLRAIRRVLPGGITATSTVSGALRVIRRVLPGGISATSTVSGSIRVIRRVAPGQISAASTVTGTLTKVAAGKFISGAISATSTLAGTVSKLARIGGVVSAISTVTGSLRAIRRVTGAISATSVVSGSLRAFRRITGAIAATSTVTGSLQVRRRILPGAISATSVVTGSIKLQGKFGGAITATSTVTGSIRVVRRITLAGILATSTLSGVVRRIRRLTGAVLATSTVSGKVSRVVHAAGVVNATSTVQGVIVAYRVISPSQISAYASVSGSMVAEREILGNIFATSTVAGAVIIQPPSNVIFGRDTGKLISGAWSQSTIMRAKYPQTVITGAGSPDKPVIERA